MDGHGVEVHVQVLHVHLHVGSGLGPVHQDLRPMVVGDLRHGLYGHRTSGDVTALAHAHQSDIPVHRLLEGLDVEESVGARMRHPHLYAGGIPQGQPRDVVGVVLGIGGDDRIPSSQTESEGDRVYRLGGVLGEDERTGRAPIEKPAERLPGLIHADGDLVGEMVDAPPSADRIFLVILHDRLDHTVRTEGLACTVEIHALVCPHRREVVTEL